MSLKPGKLYKVKEQNLFLYPAADYYEGDFFDSGDIILYLGFYEHFHFKFLHKDKIYYRFTEDFDLNWIVEIKC